MQEHDTEAAGGSADVAAPKSGAAHDTGGEAWRDVITQLDGLADAMGRWVRATANDPANRQRATEVKEHVEKMAEAVAEAAEDAAESDVGRSFKEAAVKTGEAFRVAGERAAEEIGPRVASAFRSAAERLHQAAEHMEARDVAAAAAVADPEPAGQGDAEQEVGE